MNVRPSAISILAASAAAVLAGASAAAQAARPVDFSRQIQPLLAKNCYACHGPNHDEGGLRLNRRDAATKELDSGNRAIVPGKPGESELVNRVTSDDPDERMPPKGKPLAADDVALLKRWIAAGAEFRGHWAFEPVGRPAPPQVRHAAWLRTPIDNFIAAELEAAGLPLPPRADKRTLLRRATYDLTGLPPAWEDVQAFLADDSPQAFERVVDRLLASPQYGERWGRHWLDVVRYAETNSFERDNPKPHVWRFRDYVIRSFNDDKPYDQFIREQLAGDELPQADAAAIVATGYYRLGLWDDEPSDPLQARYDGLDDIVTTTGQAFLGLTVNCARCHEHKIDPIPQRDYYRLLAFFQNVRPYQERGPQVETQIAADTGGSEPAMALSVTEEGGAAPETFVLLRGNPQAHGERVEPGFLAVLGGQDAALAPAPSGAKTSGRRTALAAWIASPENRLTARVMANRVWQHHFGRGIVRTPNNFGANGSPPTHPELLDYLAGELVGGGWRLKRLHRLVMLSSAYQATSRPAADAPRVDAANELYSRFELRRLEAEELRDSLLAASGELNLRQFGPSIYPAIAQEVLAGQSKPGYGWHLSTPAEQSRRSVYIHVKRSLVTPLLAAFDFPESDTSCEARFATTQPAQSLSMINGEFLQQRTAALAQRVARQVGADPAARIAQATRWVLGREATAEEIARGRRLLASLGENHGQSEESAWRYYCLTLLNRNEFMYLD